MSLKYRIFSFFLSCFFILAGFPAYAEQKKIKKYEYILYTRVPIPKGYEMKGAYLDWVEWPADYLSSNFITKSKCPDAIRLVSKYKARKDYEQNEVIQEAKLEPRGFSCNSNLGS